jgi:hypothetical protein
LKQPPVASPVVFRSFSNCTVKSQFKHGEILVSVGPLWKVNSIDLGQKKVN